MFPYIPVFGKNIPTYSLCILIAIAAVYILAAKDCKKRSVSVYDLIIVGIIAVSCGLFGAAVLYALVTYPAEDLLAMIRSGNFSFLEGGLVFYGGLICGIPAALLGKRLVKLSFADFEHCIIPYIPLGHAIGRIGCLLGGCCYGFAYSGPMAIYYKNSITGLDPNQGYFPTPLLEFALNLCVCAILLIVRRRKLPKGNLLASYLCCYGGVRLITELFRGDAVRGIFLNISTSQWISFALIGVSVIYLIINKKRSTKEAATNPTICSE